MQIKLLIVETVIIAIGIIITMTIQKIKDMKCEDILDRNMFFKYLIFIALLLFIGVVTCLAMCFEGWTIL